MHMMTIKLQMMILQSTIYHSMKSKQASNERIRALIKQKKLITNRDSLKQSPSIEQQQLKQQNQQKCQYQLQTFENMEISENLLLGKICGGVVVEKNQINKQLLIHLTILYDHSKAFSISANSYLAFIKDYQLKADLSIFGYLNNFKDIQVGSFINAWVRRIQKRQNNQALFELYLNRLPDSKYSNVKLGVAKDNVKIPESVLKVYQKEKKLPMNFLILYQNNYDNPGLQKTLQKGLKVDSLGSLHKVSNICWLKNLKYNTNRIRFIQERQWRNDHLELGLECIRDGKNQDAIQILKVAQKFDKQYADIYIAKACAYMNMNNTNQGIKQIKQALKIDPNNERARKYYQQFQKQLGTRGQQYPNNMKKRSSGSNFDLVYKK